MSNAEVLELGDEDARREIAEKGTGPEVRRAMKEVEIVVDTRGKIERVQKAVERTETFAKLMDKKLLDPLIGVLLPEGGDLATAAAGLYIVAEALAAGVPKGKIARMLGNIALDASIGLIPGIGDFVDFFCRSNMRNAAIFREYLEQELKGGKEEK